MYRGPLFVVLLLSANGAHCWSPPASYAASVAPALPSPARVLAWMKVTADDVEIAVETAERLWAEALEAREKAERLSEEAETMAGESEAAMSDTASSIDDASKFKLSMLGEAQQAQQASLDAGSILADALEAVEEADELEALAEAALVASEKAIEQHLVDFPDSELADEL
jgi:hypothetical protein